MTNAPTFNHPRSNQTPSLADIFSPPHAHNPSSHPRLHTPATTATTATTPRQHRTQSLSTSPLLLATIHLHNLPPQPTPPTLATRTALPHQTMASYLPQRFPPSSSSSKSHLGPSPGAWGKPAPSANPVVPALHIPAYLADTAIAALAEEQARKAQSEVQTTRGWERSGSRPKVDQSLRLPSAWNPKDKCERLELGLDGLRIEYK
ncbi:hypothetical protein BC938DRAFT_476569, partial [Jimgerdemannia flammicorona]